MYYKSAFPSVIGLLLVMVLLISCATPQSTPTVTPIPSTSTPVMEASMGPAARVYHSMVYDIDDDRVLLFGGNSYHHWGMDLQDVWAYDVAANEWEEVGVLEAGHGIEAHAPAYDQESDRVIILNRRGETWAYQFDTSQWEKMKPVEAPSGRCGHRTVYDSESDRVILFGGFKCTRTRDPLYDDTWAYDYNADTWMEMRPSVSPAARCYHGMAYDGESDRVIIWGGRPHEEVEDAAVWAYDYNSNTWTVQEANTGPPLRFAYHAMVYHPKLDKVIVFGGVVLDSTGFEGTLVDQTWAYDFNANTWTLLEPGTSPTARAKHAMAYHGVTDKIILFGGVIGGLYSNGDINGETWIYDPTNNEWINMTATSTSP